MVNRNVVPNNDATANASAPNKATENVPVPDGAKNKDKGKKRKQMETRSIVWDHFKKVHDKEGKAKARCVYCARFFSSDTKINGTSHLLYHMRNCPDNQNRDALRQAILVLEPSTNVVDIEKEGTSVGKLGTWRFSQEAIRASLAYMIIVDELPFRFVEGEGFQKLMSVACPQFKIPSRWTVTRDCYQLYLNERSILKAFLENHSQRVSLTTDTWTRNQRINYICVTAHWVCDEFKLHKRIISFFSITSHKGEYIAKALDDALIEWGLTNIFTVTVDNASSNDVAMTHFKDRLITHKTAISDALLVHMRCIAHILNLVVTDGLKDMNPSVMKVRECVRWVRSSPSRVRKLNELVELLRVDCQKSFCLDVPTRWNSTYMMLEVASSYERVFRKYEVDDSSFRSDLKGHIPDYRDWSIIRMLSQCLSHFYYMTLRISGSCYVTCNKHFCEICDLSVMLNALIDNPDSKIKEMGKNTRAKFDKYWGDPYRMNKLIFFANVFDPTVKFDYMELYLPKMYGPVVGNDLFVQIQYDLKTLYAEYVALYDTSFAATASTPMSQPNMCDLTLSQANSQPVVSQSSGSGGKFFSQSMADFKQHRINKGARKKSELETYLFEDVIDANNLGILKWWKMNSERFPVLSRMARDILTILVSTVASESAFSTSGCVLDCFRSFLTPKFVATLICTQDWLRPTKIALDVEEQLEELEKLEQELQSVNISTTDGSGTGSETK